MRDQTCNNQSVLLSTEPAEQKHQRLAVATVLFSLLIFIAAIPFAHVQFPPVWPFMPIYQSALVINDLITAVILFSQFNILRMRALLVLACGYLFTAVIAAIHLLTFPGLFSATGLLGAGPQTTAWLYMVWHAGFPLTVIAYAVLGQRNVEPRPQFPSSGFFPILTGITVVLALAYIVTLITTVGHNLLPSIMQNDRYTATMVFVVATVWVSSGAALILLWKRQRSTTLDIWLMVVMCSWIFDVGLSAVFNGGRFDLGFYFGRMYGLFSSVFVLTVLLVEMAEMYKRLAKSFEAEQEERKHEAEERRRVFETSLDLILVTDRHGNFIRVSPSCTAILGYQPDEMIGHSAVEFIHRDDLEATRNEMRSARRGHQNRNFDTRYIGKNGLIVTLAWTGVWSEPEQKHFFIGRDMTEAKKAEERLRHLAHYDQLTELPNRFSLQSDLETLIDRNAEAGLDHHSIAMLDLVASKISTIHSDTPPAMNCSKRLHSA
jgi:PAS domain S-box-containing protein